MAVAIIRQLTLAQVQAAIDAGSTSWNNNYAGTQVYVTDKDWHLACYLDRVAKPLSGVLKITNGDTLPNWLVPEILLIDTGTLTGDKSGEPQAITGISGYAPVHAYITGTYGSDFSLIDSYSNILFNAKTNTTGPIIYENDLKVTPQYYLNDTMYYQVDFGTDNIQIVIEYRKKPF